MDITYPFHVKFQNINYCNNIKKRRRDIILILQRRMCISTMQRVRGKKIEREMVVEKGRREGGRG